MGGTAGTRIEGGGSEPGIDWERDARGPFAYSGAHGAYAGSAAQGAYAGALVPGPFGGVETQRGYFQSPAAIRPQYGAQSPPCMAYFYIFFSLFKFLSCFAPSLLYHCFTPLLLFLSFFYSCSDFPNGGR